LPKAKENTAVEKDDKMQIPFEEALVRLEGIVKSLESGDTPLEESISLFEEGVKLTGYCNKVLNNAEQRVSVIIKTPEGNMTEEIFDKDE